MPNDISHTDFSIGDASNHRVVISNVFGSSTSGEQFSKIGPASAFVNVASGDKFYARSQASVAQTGFSATVYGVGGG